MNPLKGIAIRLPVPHVGPLEPHGGINGSARNARSASLMSLPAGSLLADPATVMVMPSVVKYAMKGPGDGPENGSSPQPPSDPTPAPFEPSTNPIIRPYSELTAADRAFLSPEMRSLLDHLPVLDARRYPELSGLEESMAALATRGAQPKDGKGPIYLVILDDSRPNAFVTRAKNSEARILGLNLGMIRRFQNDDQAAAIIGHELEHLTSELYPWLEEMMKEAEGDLDKLFLLQREKAEEIEVDLKSLFWRVHRMGLNPNEMLNLMNQFLADSADGSDEFGFTHPLMKTRRNAVEFALTGMRRILGEKISESEPQNHFVTPRVRQFLQSPAFASSRRESFSIPYELQEELTILLGRIQSDTLTKDDLPKNNYSNHPVFDRVVRHLLEQNRREIDAFQDEAQKIDLHNRVLCYADRYFESRIVNALGEDYTPGSANRLAVFYSLQYRRLDTPSWEGQFFTAGKLMQEIGKETAALEKLESEFRRQWSRSDEDIKEYEGRRTHYLKEIEKLTARQKAHVSAFHDVREVQKAMEIYRRWGLSPGSSLRIPDDVLGRAHDILWRNLRHIGPLMLVAEARRRKIREIGALQVLKETADISDLHRLVNQGAASPESGEDIQRLFVDRYFVLAEEALSSGMVDPEIWSSIQNALSPMTRHSVRRSPLDALQDSDPEGFYRKAQPVFEKLARSVSSPGQFDGLLSDVEGHAEASHGARFDRDQIIANALSRVGAIAVREAQSVSAHTPEEVLSRIIKPRYGDADLDHLRDGTHTVTQIRRDEWDQLPDGLEVLDLTHRDLRPLGTVGELRQGGKTPPPLSHGYSEWGLKLPSAPNDLRSYLPYLDQLWEKIELCVKRERAVPLKGAFSALASHIHGILSNQPWYHLTSAEWNTVLLLRYGRKVMAPEDTTLRGGQAAGLIRKLKDHPAYREVVDVHRFMEWMSSEGVREDQAFEWVLQCGDTLKIYHAHFYANDPEGEYARKVMTASRFLRWLSLLGPGVDFREKKPFVALLEMIIRNPASKDSSASADDEVRGRHLIPFLKAEMAAMEAAQGYEAACRQITASLTSPRSVHRYRNTEVLLAVTEERPPDQRAFALEQLLRMHRAEHDRADFGSTPQEKPVEKMFADLVSGPLSAVRRAGLLEAALDYSEFRGDIFDAHFEGLWGQRGDPSVRTLLGNPELVGALQFHANKKKLAQWQLNDKFRLDRTEKKILSGNVATPHHATVRPVVYRVKEMIDRQFPKRSTLKDAIIDFAEEKLVSTPAENDLLRPGRLDTTNWYKASELSLVDLPSAVHYAMQSNFDRLEIISYLVRRHQVLPRFAARGFVNTGHILGQMRRAFIEASPYVRAALLQGLMDESDGIFSDRRSIEELERLVLGDYSTEPVFRAIYKAYLTAAPRAEVRVLLASLLSTFVDAPEGSRGPSLKEILNSMGPFGWKAGQFMRSSGLVGRKLAEELDSLYDRAAPPSRKKIVEDLRLVFGDSLARVHGIRELKGSGSINYVVVVDLIAPDGSLQRAAVQIKRDNVEGLVHNENQIWQKAIAELRANPDIAVQRSAGIVDEARRHSMATLRAGGDELDLSTGAAKYPDADQAYANARGERSGRRISACRPVDWAMRLVPDHLRDKFAVYEYVDFTPLAELPEQERGRIIRDIITAELTAIREREAFDPDGHRGNWLVSRDGKDLTRIDYAQLRRVSKDEGANFFTLFNQMALTIGLFSAWQIGELSRVLPGLFESLPPGVPIERILENSLNAPDAPGSDRPHERLLYLRDRLSDFIQDEQGDPAYLLQFTDGARSMLTSIAKIAGYRAYMPELEFRLAMAEGLGLI